MDTWGLGYVGIWILGYLGTWECVTWELVNLGTWDLGYSGTWALWNLGAWELGYLGSWILEVLGTWEFGNLGMWYLGTWELWVHTTFNFIKQKMEYWCSHEDPNYTPSALHEVFLFFQLIAPFHLLVISLVIQLHSFYY